MELQLPSGTLTPGLSDVERYLYDQLNCENWSGLKSYTVPQKARWRELHPEDTDTAALKFGRMAHLLILQQEIFNENYICTPTWPHGAGHLRMVKGKTTKDEGEQNRIEKIAWEAEHRDREWVAIDDWKQLHGMRNALMDDPITRSILSYPDSLREFTCLSELGDGWSKSMFDIVLDIDPTEAQAMFGRDDVEGGIWIGDYKTARSAAPDKFKWAVRDYGYKGQAAYYFDNYARATGIEPAGFFFFAQDKYDGFTPCVYLVTPGQIKQGRSEWEHLLKVKQLCKKNQVWPGYATGAIYLGDF